jgi:hypothetical protein
MPMTLSDHYSSDPTLMSSINIMSALLNQPAITLPVYLTRRTHGVTRKPTSLPVRVDGIPKALRAERRWVVWSYVWKEGPAGKDGKWDKPPCIATAPQTHAKSTDPATWRSFAEALATYEDRKCDGIGFVLGDGWVGFDADETDASHYVAILNTYPTVLAAIEMAPPTLSDQRPDGSRRVEPFIDPTELAAAQWARAEAADPVTMQTLNEVRSLAEIYRLAVSSVRTEILSEVPGASATLPTS